MGLKEYRKKRDFERTAEPAGRGTKRRAARAAGMFTVQKHDASHLHYDFRLEMEGVLRSWAVPKGPSLDPADKRLAVQVEDHPLEYGGFEGTIPKGEYGGGTVLLWDRGRWFPAGDPVAGWKAGKLEFRLAGRKLEGNWALVRIRGRSGDARNWLLMKRKDEEARPRSRGDVLEQRPESVTSGRDLEAIAANRRGATWSSKSTPARSAGAKRRSTSSAATVSARATAKSRGGESEVAGVRITHPDRVLYPDDGITKVELARWYESMAERILPHLAGRPLTFMRCPGGQGKACFIQRHLTGSLPAGIRAVPVREEGGVSRYLAIENVSGLVALVQLSVLEFHVWGARAADLDRPDRMIFDLDPGPGVAWSSVIDAAHLVRRALKSIGLESFAKTTGGKGLHVVVPLRPRASWDEAGTVARGLAETIAGEDPGHFTARNAKAGRQGRIYIDYLRNARGASAVAAWSTRARPGATVATPLAWSEVTKELAPESFTVHALPKRLARSRRDPWPGFFAARQTLTAAMVKAFAGARSSARTRSSVRRSGRARVVRTVNDGGSSSRSDRSPSRSPA